MTTYHVQVWAFCGYGPKVFMMPFGPCLFFAPVLRWIDVYTGPDKIEAEISRDVFAEQVAHVRLLKLEKVNA